MKRLEPVFKDPDDVATVAMLVILAFVWVWFSVNEPDPNYGKEIVREVIKCEIGYKPDYWGFCKKIQPDPWDKIAARLADNMKEMMPNYQIKAIEAWEDVKEWWND